MMSNELFSAHRAENASAILRIHFLQCSRVTYRVLGFGNASSFSWISCRNTRIISSLVTK